MSILDASGLNQLNRHPSTEAGNILDLIALNIPDRVSEIELARYKYKSDHYMLDFEIFIGH